MTSIEGFILVGGASSRMGKDKSRLMLGEVTLVQKIAHELKRVSRQTTLVGREADAVELRSGLKSVKDEYEKWGALGGVHACLKNCKADWAIITACDLPFVTFDLFSRMLSFANDMDAVAPIQADGFPQPLCALYRTNPCLERSEQLITSGHRRPIDLLESVRTRWVAFDELRNLSGSAHFFDNINTPEDYLRATEKGEGFSAKG